jgi:hypothetical protein
MVLGKRLTVRDYQESSERHEAAKADAQPVFVALTRVIHRCVCWRTLRKTPPAFDLTVIALHNPPAEGEHAHAFSICPTLGSKARSS